MFLYSYVCINIARSPIHRQDICSCQNRFQRIDTYLFRLDFQIKQHNFGMKICVQYCEMFNTLIWNFGFYLCLKSTIFRKLTTDHFFVSLKNVHENNLLLGFKYKNIFKTQFSLRFWHFFNSLNKIGCILRRFVFVNQIFAN